MSAIKLNPIVDLGLNPDTPVPEMADQMPRELEMDTVNQQSMKPVNGFTGIMDITSAKELLKKTEDPQVAMSQQPISANSTVAQTTPSAGAAVVQPAVPVSNSPVAAPSDHDDKGGLIFMVIAVVLFLISLSAAGYFIYQYYWG